MGRKETLSALVGGMIAFAAYEWQSETSAFFDSIFPNAGYYAVRIIFSIATIYVLVVVVYWVYGKFKGKPTDESKAPYFEKVEIDHKLDHVEAKAFQPFYFWWPIVGKLMGKDTEFHRLPRHVLIINRKTKIAYPPGDYGLSLLHPARRIAFSFARQSWPYAKLEEWCATNGLELSTQSLVQSDVEETVQCKTCKARFVPRGLSAQNPVLHADFGGILYAYTICPACGNSVRFSTQDSRLGTFVVSIDQSSNSVREINVVSASGEISSRQARVYTISVGVPIGAENAINLRLFYRLLNTAHPQGPSKLETIPVPASPFFTVPWTSQGAFLPKLSEHFANALVLGGTKSELSVSAGSNHLSLAILVLFFTVHESDWLYFPSRANPAAIQMPAMIDVEVYSEADNKPQTFLTRLRIQAHSWESFEVNEALESS